MVYNIPRRGLRGYITCYLTKKSYITCYITCYITSQEGVKRLYNIGKPVIKRIILSHVI